MSIPIEKQETIISFSREDERAVIYTSDSVMMAELNKLIGIQGTEWKMGPVITEGNGDETARTYSCPKGLISFRSKELTERQKTIC